jgi:hypothetical protein
MTGFSRSDLAFIIAFAKINFHVGAHLRVRPLAGGHLVSCPRNIYQKIPKEHVRGGTPRGRTHGSAPTVHLLTEKTIN